MKDTFDRLVVAQGGVIKHAQALEAGFSKHEVETLLKNASWLRLFHGIHLTASGPALFEQWCQAALLRCGPDSVLWGKTAARLHDLDGFTPPPKRRATDLGLPICIAAPHSVACTEKLAHVRVRDLSPLDTTMAGELRCASVTRAFIDLAEHCSWRTLVMAFEDLHRRGLHTVLDARIDQLFDYRPWLGRVRRLMARRGPNAVPTESAGEAICDDILQRAGLIAERQFPVRIGRSDKRIDLAFPEFRVGIEVDSRAWHGDDRYESDRERAASITAMGWSQLHFTWLQLQNEPKVRRIVRAALVARGWRPTPQNSITMLTRRGSFVASPSSFGR